MVDDHLLFLEGLAKIINDSGVANVRNTAHTMRGCWEMLDDSPEIDVLLLDIYLPDGNGIDFCPIIKSKFPKLNILVLTSISEYAVVKRLLDSGISGYIMKTAECEEVVQGILTVAEGERFLCEATTQLLKRKESTAIKLSGKERQLLRLICDGYNSSEIARVMCFSLDTINSYRKNLLFKLNARNTSALVRIAIENKLI
jgi:DNA-binding NarL/FixJ family response regulator